jgi:deoxyribodipyrimidine photo-lyase
VARAIVWFRRDLRLSDNPALAAALADGHQPIPLYIHAPDEEAPWAPGAASRAWLERSLRALDTELRALGSQLLVLRGESGAQLQALIAASGATAVYWNRLYEPACIARDRVLKVALRERGIAVSSHNAALLVEPWQVATQKGDPYRVFTPFWRTALARLPAQFAVPSAPVALPSSPAIAGHAIDSLGLSARPQWDAGFWSHWQPGEAGAQEALSVFLDDAVRGYKAQRDIPGRVGTSRLSPHLHFGEISPRQIWNALATAGLPAHCDAHLLHYRNELGWREFSHHLLFHYPHTPERNLDARFDGFAWAEPDQALLKAWQSGRTGVPLIDAGMRELWHSGWMHNRVRMVVASFLCKNLRIHWTHGARWFWDTLLDADLAANTQGWQWSAGTGADAAPYFRIFSPASQAARFDPDGVYIRRWCPELAALPERALHAPWLHRELLARVAPSYPAPIVDIPASRDAALAAWQTLRALTPTEPA